MLKYLLSAVTSGLCYDVWTVLWRPYCVLTSELCYDVRTVFWRLDCVMTSGLCSDVRTVFWRPYCVMERHGSDLHYHQVLLYLSLPQIVKGRRRKGLRILPLRRLLMAEPTEPQQVTLSEKSARDVPGASLSCCWSGHGRSWQALWQNVSQTLTSCFVWYEALSKIFRTDAVKIVKITKLTIRPIGRHHPRSSPLPHVDTGPTVSSIFGTLPESPFLSEYQTLTAIRPGSPQWYRTGVLSASISFFEICLMVTFMTFTASVRNILDIPSYFYHW
jgi:hypothetical protein